MATIINPAGRENYVLMSAGTLRLLLPQKEVGDAEYLENALCATEVPGLLKQCESDNPRRFVALSENMELLPECPPGRFMATRIGHGVHEDELEWCWDEIKVLLAPEFQLEPLPPVLITAETPFTHYVELEGRLAFLSNSEHLHAVVFGPHKD
jgi:hypothetical protein